MWNLVTLDGYFEGPKPWEIDWHDTVWGPELERLSIDQLSSAGGLLFGRVTYEGMAGFWPTQKGEVAELMNRIPKFVFSRTLTRADWSNSQLVREDAAREVARLREQDGKDLFLFGSARLSSALTAAGLIDEYRIAIAPILLGGGNPLFKPMPNRLKLKLLEARPLDSGGMILRYAPAP